MIGNKDGSQRTGLFTSGVVSTGDGQRIALFFSGRQHAGENLGDMYMSLIHSCELCGARAFDYLTELQRHAAEVAAKPADWMPWNYRQAAGAAQNAA